MKALIEYFGLTQMVEVNKNLQYYEICVSTTGDDYYNMVKNLSSGQLRQQIYLNSVQKYKYLIFMKKETVKVDGEDIAIFKFYEER